MNYGQFGGQYVPNELKQKLNTIKIEFERSKKDPDFLKSTTIILRITSADLAHYIMPKT